jgi:hypothetical protein
MADKSAAPRIWDRKDLLPVALFFVLFLLMFREFFFTGKTIFDRDVTLWEIPARKLCAQLLRAGDFALWTDAFGGGQPFLANPKTAALYPAIAIYLLFPFFVAFKLYYLIHAALTWTGLYFLGKSYALSRRASFLGASLFVFGGMYLSSFEFYNHIAALAWLPWILILFVLPARRWVPRIAALTVLWTLSLLAGAPEMTLMTLALAALQIVFLAPGRKRRFLLLAGSLLLAVLISAAQLFPSFELLRRSERISLRSADWPLEAVQLLNLSLPNILGSDREPGHHVFWAAHFFDRGYPLYYSLYVGIAALVLAIWALRRPKNRRVLFLGVSIILFLILASGRYSPFYRLLGSIPLVSSIRYPVKFFLGSMLSICWLAAAGYDDLFHTQPVSQAARRALASVLAALGLLIAVLARPLATAIGRALAAGQAENAAEIRTSLFSAAVLAVLAASIALLSTISRGSHRFLSTALIGLIVLDLAYHNRHINPLVPTSFFDRAGFSAGHAPVRLFREDDVPKSLQRGKTDILVLSSYARQSVYPLTGIGDGFFYLFDRDTLDIYPREYRKLSEAVVRLSGEDRAKVLQTEGCQYSLSHARLPGFFAQELETEQGLLLVHKLDDSAPEVRLVHDYVVAASLEKKLQVCLQKEFDPSRTAIVEEDLPIGQGVPGRQDEAVEVTENRQGRIRCLMTLAHPGIAVLPGNSAKGWKAWIDGLPAAVFGANLSSKGVLVPAGRHRVELRYLPGSFVVGVAVSIVSLLAMCAWILVSGPRGDKPKASVCLAACVFL